MDFCGMKREIDRKCLNHARVHARARSFDRCEAYTSSLHIHSGQTTGHSREHARDLSTSGQFPSSSHKMSTVNLRHSSHLGTKFNHFAPANVLFPSFTA